VFSSGVGRAIAQAVSPWLPTGAARVRARFWSSGIFGGQSGVGACFLGVLRFPLPIIIPPNTPSSQSPGAGTIGQKWPTCRVDPVWTQPPHYEISEQKSGALPADTPFGLVAMVTTSELRASTFSCFRL
jgi:hypothetical protein